MVSELTKAQRALQETVRAFAETELKPGAARRDETARHVTATTGAREPQRSRP